MPKRSSRPKHPDLNQFAASIVGEATSEEPEAPAQPEKNPHAQALGRLGGRKGGKARAVKLTPQQRREIAKKAAEKRWANKAHRET
jgi:hypothetical protein